MSNSININNENNSQNFVTIINGYSIYKLSATQFQAVKRTRNISSKVVDSFTTSTLLEAVSQSMNGQKLVSNQLQRVREAVIQFAQNELPSLFNFAH